jgi:hypothetical protein
MLVMELVQERKTTRENPAVFPEFLQAVREIKDFLAGWQEQVDLLLTHHPAEGTHPADRLAARLRKTKEATHRGTRPS